MKRNSKRKVVAGLVVTLGVADGVGIYVAQHRLDKGAEVGPRELAVANAPLTQPIAIQADGGLMPRPVFAQSSIGPQAAPAQAQAPQTVRFALPEPLKVPEAARAAVAPAVASATRQTAAVASGRLARAEAPAPHRAESRHSTAVATGFLREEDLRLRQQHIPARLSHAERRPASDDQFDVAFGNSGAEARLPDPGYEFQDSSPRGQATAELPPLELSPSQIHAEPSGTSDADAPPAPPATAAGAEDMQPKS